jgi:type II secretory pathway component GspD/PulD (secretin)
MMKSHRIGLIASTSILAALAGTSQTFAGQPGAVAPASPGTVLDAATKELSSGSAVRAREMLLSASSLNMTESERTRSIELLQQADDKIRSMDPRQVSLERAKVALDCDDLRTAERLASALNSTDAGANRAAAQNLLNQITTRKSHVAQLVDNKLAAAVTAADAKDFARAKGLVDVVNKWNVPLTPAQADAVDSLRGKVIAAEQERGRAFRADAGEPVLAAAMLAEPGVIERREPEPAQQQVLASAASTTESTMQAQPVAGEDPVVAARRTEATNLLAEAEQAFNDSRYNEAQTKYSKLRTQFREFLTADQSKQVDDRLAEARLRLRGNSPDGRDLQGFIEQGTVARQQAQAEFDNQLVQATDALKSGDTIRARDAAARARLILNSNRERFAETEFQTMQGKVSDFLKQVDTEEQKLAAARAAAAAQANLDASNRTAAEGARERDRKIREAIDRVRALQVEMKYEEALQVVDQILFLDPINPTGLLLRDVLTSARIYRTWGETNRKRNIAIADQALDNQLATLAGGDIVSYPEDWPNVIKDRGEPVTLAEPVETRQALSTLSGTRRPVDFAETPLEKALDWVAKASNVRMDIDWPSLEKIGVNKDTPVTANLSTIRLDHLLDLVVRKVSPDPTSAAAWEVQDGILRVASAETINRSTLMVIYDIKDLLIVIRDYSAVPQFDLNSSLQAASSGGGGGGGQSPFQGGTQQTTTGGPTQEELTDELVRLLTEQVDPDNWRENGGSVGFVSRYKGNLLITQTPKNHRAIGALLRRLREIRAMQVNSEARFLLVSQAFFEQIGFDIDVYLNSGLLNVNERVNSVPGVTGTFVQQNGVPNNTNPTLFASDFFNTNGVFQRSFIGQPTSIFNPAARTVATGNPLMTVNNTQGLGPVGFTQNSLGIANALTTAPFAAEVLNAGRGFTASGTFLDDIQVDFLIQATQADRRNINLQAPRLTTTNGQEANIQITNQLTYISGLTPITNQGAVAFQPITNSLNTGVLMRVRGTISADRRYVTADILTQISQLVRFRTGQTFAAVGGGGLGGGSATIPSGTFQLPEVSLSSVQTTVTIPDQGTILLGGQRLVDEQEVESGVPVLSKIPIINRFFSNRSTTKEERTLLILYKPTILIQNEQENKAHPGLIDSLNAGIGG